MKTSPYEIDLPSTINATSLSETLGEAASMNVCKSQSTWKNGAHWSEKSLLDAVLEAEEIRCRRDLPSPATVSDALELLEDGFTLVVE